jgi:hypothetical protein
MNRKNEENTISGLKDLIREKEYKLKPYLNVFSVIIKE